MGHLQHANFGDYTQQWCKSDKTGNLFNTEDKQDSAARTKSTSWHSGVCESFVPCGKITNGKHYSIITDHLGTPIEAYNQEGELIWEREQDLYGNSRQGFAKENFKCPFKYQGQYYDSEVELCYNRFRYYHPETGRYISEDPIKLLGGFNVFAYVSDTNIKLDELGLLGEEFDVGLHKDLQKQKKDPDLRSHHVGQKAIMPNLVANYDEDNAPAILVHKEGHNNRKLELIEKGEKGTVSTKQVDPMTNKPFVSVRDLVARDIKELRRVYSNVSNEKLKELIELNKSMYPEMKVKSQRRKMYGI